MSVTNLFPDIRAFRSTALSRCASPEIVFSHLHHHQYAALLCGRGTPDNARFAYIGFNPFLRICHTLRGATVTVANKEFHVSLDPFQLLSAAVQQYSVAGQPFPISSWGAIGYLSYDAAHCIERLPMTAPDDIGMPLMEMVFYQDLLVFDCQRASVFLVQVDVGNGYSDVHGLTDVLEAGMAPLDAYRVSPPASCCTQEQYVMLVQRIIDYIKRGDVYEVNLSHRFRASYKGDAYCLFMTLYRINPAPFSAFLNYGDTVIISNSPERFLRAEKRWVETRPIKGTIRRSDDSDEDRKNRMTLLNSAKDEAELAMIVDLLRNDLGKVCDYGSVRVREHKRIEGFTNVWHLVSIVEGTIRADQDYGSLVKACFPGGSVTGCPKIRSMEIIDELESYARNLYTGMIFIINDTRLDSSIVIRTIIARRHTLYFSVGGAVVYDSVPEQEYEETLAKAQSIMIALGQG